MHICMPMKEWYERMTAEISSWQSFLQQNRNTLSEASNEIQFNTVPILVLLLDTVWQKHRFLQQQKTKTCKLIRPKQGRYKQQCK